MKRVSTKLIVVLFLLGGILLFSQAAFAQLKIGYINSQRILEEYDEAQDVQKKLDAKNKEWQRQAQQMQQEIQQMQEQLDSQSLLLSEEKKDEKMREIQEKYTELQQFQQEKWSQNGEAFQLQQELMQPIFDKIDGVLKEIGKEEDFDYIFDGVGGNIVYASEDQIDLTDRVIEKLNKGVAASEEGS